LKNYGGFEGNAQTLRILARLERRENIPAHPTGIDDLGRDLRCGLNLTARVLASVLKYDNEIPFERKSCDALEKGYYQSERHIVQWFKQKVAPQLDSSGKFKTVECQIMDIADDIAYSTYDLEDALKAKFFLPLDAIVASREIVEEVSREVSKPGALGVRFTPRQVEEVLNGIFGEVARFPPRRKRLPDRRELAAAKVAYRSSLWLANDGHLRVEFTSVLVRKFINSVRLKPNADIPALSQVYLAPAAHKRVEVLKRFNFVSLIMSPRLKVAEFRGGDIVKTIFEALADQSNDGHRLLPDDFQRVFERIEQHQRRRVICDFIAGMTDRYALEFYGRLKSENPQTMFKPL
jgi:dGTPase